MTLEIIDGPELVYPGATTWLDHDVVGIDSRRSLSVWTTDSVQTIAARVSNITVGPTLNYGSTHNTPNFGTYPRFLKADMLTDEYAVVATVVKSGSTPDPGSVYAAILNISSTTVTTTVNPTLVGDGSSDYDIKTSAAVTAIDSNHFLVVWETQVTLVDSRVRASLCYTDHTGSITVEDTVDVDTSTFVTNLPGHTLSVTSSDPQVAIVLHSNGADTLRGYRLVIDTAAGTITPGSRTEDAGGGSEYAQIRSAKTTVNNEVICHDVDSVFVVRVTSSTMTVGTKDALTGINGIPYSVSQEVYGGNALVTGGGPNANDLQIFSFSHTGLTVNEEDDLTPGQAGRVARVARMGRNIAIVVYGNSTTQLSSILIGEFLGVARPLGVAVAKDGSGLIAVTAWRADELFIQLWSTPDLTFDSEAVLGSCTEAQLDAGTYVAYPYIDWDGNIYAYGRMQDPQSLGDPAHIVYHDGSWNLLEDGWGADVCGSLLVGYGGYIFAARNVDGGGVRLYRGLLSGLVFRSTSPLNYGVRPHGMTKDPLDGTILLASDTGDSVMVAGSPSNYSVWYDLTSDHGTSDGINAIEVL